MMMRAVFSIALLALPATLVSASDPAASKPLLDLAALIRTHGFVNPSFVQPADEPVVGDAAAPAADAAPAAEVSVVESTVATDAPPAEAVSEPVAEGDAAASEDSAAIADGDCCGPTVTRYYYVKPKRKVLQGGLIDEVIELEQRKNAWLKRNLLGR